MISLDRIYGLDVNLDNLAEMYPKIEFKQYDYQTSYIALKFFKDGNLVENISDNYIIGVFKDKNGDLFVDTNGSPIRSYAFEYTREVGIVVLPISKEVIDKTGNISCEIIIINEKGNKVTSPRFNFNIQPSLIDFKLEQEQYLETVCGTFKSGQRLCGHGNVQAININEYITYEKTVWVDGETVVNQERLNKIEDGIYNATQHLNNLNAGSVRYTTSADESIVTIQDALDKLLYIPLTINLSSNVSTTLEKGYTVNNISFSWSYNKNIVSQKFNNIDLDTSIRKYEYDLPFNSNKSFKLEANDGKSNFNKSIGFSFLNGRYWGVSSSNNYNSNFILNLSKELVENKSKTFTVNCGENQYIFYCVPSRLGTCSFKVGGFEGGFNKVSTIQFTNSNGYTENYDIYKSTNSNLGNTTVVVS